MMEREREIELRPRFVVENGMRLAEGGDVKAAITAFQEAQGLDPDIDLDPTTKIIENDPQAVAQKLADLGASKRKILEGKELARKRETDKALQAYAEAEKLNPSLAIDGAFWNKIAWNVTLGGNAAKGLEAGEKAVRLTAEGDHLLAGYRDTRGLARALTGDTQGAIEDFEAFIASDVSQTRRGQRQEWVNALRKGQQPFTPQLLETLWSQ